MFQDKQNLAIPSRRKVKIIHSLVPDGHLGTWHISALGPHVRFTLDEHGGLVGAEVEAAEFFPFTDANWCGKISGQLDATMGEKISYERFEIITSMSIADRSDSLKIVDVHGALMASRSLPRNELIPHSEISRTRSHAFLIRAAGCVGTAVARPCGFRQCRLQNATPKWAARGSTCRPRKTALDCWSPAWSISCGRRSALRPSSCSRTRAARSRCRASRAADSPRSTRATAQARANSPSR